MNREQALEICNHLTVLYGWTQVIQMRLERGLGGPALAALTQMEKANEALLTILDGEGQRCCQRIRAGVDIAEHELSNGWDEPARETVGMIRRECEALVGWLAAMEPVPATVFGRA